MRGTRCRPVQPVQFNEKQNKQNGQEYTIKIIHRQQPLQTANSTYFHFKI